MGNVYESMGNECTRVWGKRVWGVSVREYGELVYESMGNECTRVWGMRVWGVSVREYGELVYEYGE